MTEKVLITGGAGFIGSALSLALNERGYKVRVIDNLSRQIHGENPEESALYRKIVDHVEFIHGDVTDPSIWTKVMNDIEIVIHLAAETGTGQSMYEIIRYNEVNAGGTGMLMDFLANHKHNVKKVILASSRAVYGEGKYLCPEHGIEFPAGREETDMSSGIYNPRCPICRSVCESVPTTEDSKIRPKSVYGATKYSQEMLVSIVCAALSIPFVVFRFQNVYGPGQSLTNPYTGILSIFSTRMRSNKPINIFEDGLESRDFVYIDDIVNAVILGIEKNSADGLVLNAGSGTATTVKQAADTLLKLLNSNSKIEITGNYRVGDIRHNTADLSQIKNCLGYVPAIHFDEGVKHFIGWVFKQETVQDDYENSLNEMKKKGLFK